LNHEQNSPIDVEQQLGRVMPRPAPETLRRSVLAVVSAELSAAQPTRRWERPVAWSAAGLLVASVALNVFVARSCEARLAQLFESEPQTFAEVQTAIESVAEQGTAWSMARQLFTVTAALPTQPFRDPDTQDVQRLLTEWTLHGGDWVNAQSLEDSPMDRRRSDDSRRSSIDGCRDPQLARELAA
jgi:hypothetical protein